MNAIGRFRSASLKKQVSGASGALSVAGSNGKQSLAAKRSTRGGANPEDVPCLEEADMRPQHESSHLNFSRRSGNAARRREKDFRNGQGDHRTSCEVGKRKVADTDVQSDAQGVDEGDAETVSTSDGGEGDASDEDWYANKEDQSDEETCDDLFESEEPLEAGLEDLNRARHRVVAGRGH